MAPVIINTQCYMNITSHCPEVHTGGVVLEGFDVIIPDIGASGAFYGMDMVHQFFSRFGRHRSRHRQRQCGVDH